MLTWYFTPDLAGDMNKFPKQPPFPYIVHSTQIEWLHLKVLYILYIFSMHRNWIKKIHLIVCAFQADSFTRTGLGC